MTQRLVVRIVILQSFIQSSIAVTCYGYGGGAFTGNVICPGSNTCCGASATCQSNRLCHNPGDSNSTFVRGPCAVQPYDPDTCADICLYDEVTGILPRVTPCADGSLCCNNDPQCCIAGRGAFLDDIGDVVSSLPSTTSSRSPATSSTISTSSPSGSLGSTSVVPSPSSPAVSSTATPSPLASEASSSLSTGTKIGLGVGIPLGVLVLGLLSITIWFQRRRIKIAETANQGTEPSVEPLQGIHDEPMPQGQQQYPTPMHEMESHKWPLVTENQTSPVELPAR